MHDILYVLVGLTAMQFALFIGAVAFRWFKDSRKRLQLSFIDKIVVMCSAVSVFAIWLFVLPRWLFGGYLFDPYIAFFVFFPCLVLAGHIFVVIKNRSGTRPTARQS